MSSSGYPNSQRTYPGQRAVGRTGAVASLNGRATAPLSRKETYPGIDGVLDAAGELVTKYTGDERVRALALKITRSARKDSRTGMANLRDVDAVADSIYKWMTHTINWVPDPWDIELLQSPLVTIRQKSGDCDDHAILSAALLQSVGVRTGFRIVSRSGHEFDHIYSVYQSPEGWKSFDTTILKEPGYEFDERLIAKSRQVENRIPNGIGLPSPLSQKRNHNLVLYGSIALIAIAGYWAIKYKMI